MSSDFLKFGSKNRDVTHQVSATTAQPRDDEGEKSPKLHFQAPLETFPKPEFIASRAEMFERLKKIQDARITAEERVTICITLKDGSQVMGTSWETCPFDVALGIGRSLADRIVTAKVDGELWDLERPFEKSATLDFFDFESPEGKRVWWDSSAHILGECCERHYGGHLVEGCPTDEGFYCEMRMDSDRVISQSDYPALETLAKSIVKDKQKFQRLVATKTELLDLFAYSPLKVQMIKDQIADGGSSTVYRCGSMIDVCAGPHLPHTGLVKWFSVLKNSASYFLGDPHRENLQRVHGISFPEKKRLEEYKKSVEDAAKRDHRRIGKDQELFFFDEVSPGSAFWMPHGARIYNTLVEFRKEEYRKHRYEEVITPNMYNSKLWKESGHWENYVEDMFKLNVDKEEFALKPMNCPGHCLIFLSRDRSYRELPIRMAEFGVQHRNEASGALTGLTRVRRFQQDDAHHFCTPDQIEQEIGVCLKSILSVYSMFGLEYTLKLSTRPEKYLGEISTWDKAEKILSEALDKFFPGKWTEKPGDGAFYGPKIDLNVSKWQCATIQLDFQLPQRFNLTFTPAESSPIDPSRSQVRPVMIHRAILGSLERFIALLIEHYAGKWPFWISPRQVLVVPVMSAFNAYAQRIRDRLWDTGFYADVDISEHTMQKKIRNGEIASYNFIFVVGSEEVDSQSVNIRNRDDIISKLGIFARQMLEYYHATGS